MTLKKITDGMFFFKLGIEKVNSVDREFKELNLQ